MDTENTETEAATPVEPVVEKPSYASYDDFMKLDITIGTILSVEVVEGADKLLKLAVDVNEAQPRQIISGIREYFEDVQFLVGKQCPFVTNLEPRVIRGFESQGMILAAEHDGVFSLLIPHNELPSGTSVS
ncbi:MAG: methionyl-tRNA synthetase [Patiriisocius sp.]|jgi:methionyl-tRNA synthetase